MPTTASLEAQSHQALGQHRSNVIFSVRDDPCFWYGSEAKGTAANKASSAANAFSQRHHNCKESPTMIESPIMIESPTMIESPESDSSENNHGQSNSIDFK